MKVGIPRNIFASMFALLLSDEQKENTVIDNAASIVSKIENDELDIGLIPSLDIVKLSDLYVSSKIGIAFDSEVSNSFIYFKENQSDINSLLIRGDVSTNEIVLSKIIFSELYDVDVDVKLDTQELDLDNKNNLIVGNQNFDNNLFLKGVSFSNQVADLIDSTYVNFILVSKSEEKLLEFESSISNLDGKLGKQLKELCTKLKLDDEVYNYLLLNLDGIFFDLSEVEIAGLHELIKLPYFHGIVDDIKDIKFTKMNKSNLDNNEAAHN